MEFLSLPSFYLDFFIPLLYHSLHDAPMKVKNVAENRVNRKYLIRDI